MSWISMATLTAQLPDEGGLRAAAFQLRGAGDTLAGQASVTRGVADSIGPGVWNDDASGTAKSLLHELADELGSGGSAMHQSANALETLAGYVSSQRWRYEEAGRQLEALARDPSADLHPAKLAEATRLLEERRSIEWSVRAAMGQAGDVINQAAALATRYHGSGGKSVWSRIGHFFADLGSGAWDGTYEMARGLLGLAVTLAKLSPQRAMFDPIGYAHDAEHAAYTIATDGYAIAHHKKEFAENLLNLRELKSDPVHWAGELVPSIALAFASGGLGLGAKGADGIEAVDATATAAKASSFPRETIEHVTNGIFNKNDVPVGFHSAPGGVIPSDRMITKIYYYNSNGTYRADVAFRAPDGTWIAKPVPIHTMFPDSWDHADIARAINEAFNNRVMIGTYKWEGKYNGVTIQGYMKPDGTPTAAFPAAGQ